jgi:hypothetical protein
MVRKNKIFKICLGFIFSFLICGFIVLLIKGDKQAVLLKELSIYYQSIDENNLSNKFLKGYFFFNNSFLYCALLLIPIFRFFNSYITRNYLFYLQFILSYVISIFVIYYNEIIESIQFHHILSFVILVIIEIYIINNKINQSKGDLFESYELSQIEKISLLILMCLYFFIITRLQSFIGLLNVLMFTLSLSVALLIPLALKSLFQRKVIKFYKSLTFIFLVILTLLIVNTSIKSNRYIGYYTDLPNNFIFNKDTAFKEKNGELEKNCNIELNGLRCSINNYNGLFDDYFFDQATLTINSASEINELNNVNYQIRMVFSYSQTISEGGTDIIIVDEFTKSISEDHYMITLNLKEQLNKYMIRDYSLIYLTFDFVDLDTNESFNLDLSDYKIMLTKHYRYMTTQENSGSQLKLMK